MTYPYVEIQTRDLSFGTIATKVLEKIYKKCPSLEKCDLQIGYFGETFYYNRDNVGYYLKGYYLQDAHLPNVTYGKGYISRLYDAMIAYYKSYGVERSTLYT